MSLREKSSGRSDLFSYPSRPQAQSFISSTSSYFVGGRRHRLSTAEVKSMPMKMLKDR